MEKDKRKIHFCLNGQKEKDIILQFYFSVPLLLQITTTVYSRNPVQEEVLIQEDTDHGCRAPQFPGVLSLSPDCVFPPSKMFTCLIVSGIPGC